MRIENVLITSIVIEKDNVRTHIDEKRLESLALSITQVGLINPISLQRRNKKLILVAGQRRLRAFKLLQRIEIPAVIFDANSKLAFGMQVQENIQRESISVIDEGKAFAKAIRTLDISQKQLSVLIAKSESYVTDRIATQKYFPALTRALQNGKISFSVAREFAKILSKMDLDRYLEFAANSGVNPRTARAWVRAYKLNNKVVEHIELKNESDIDDAVNPNNKLVTGCSVCRNAVNLTEIRHLNLCSDCYKIIMQSQ